MTEGPVGGRSMPTPGSRPRWTERSPSNARTASAAPSWSRRAARSAPGRVRRRATVPWRSAPAPATRRTGAADAARARICERLQREIRDLERSIASCSAGGFETTADRLRLRRMRQQFDRQFPDGEGSATVPGTGKQSKLAEPARRSFAAYHEHGGDAVPAHRAHGACDLPAHEGGLGAHGPCAARLRPYRDPTRSRRCRAPSRRGRIRPISSLPFAAPTRIAEHGHDDRT